MSGELHFWTILDIEETRLPDLRRLENLLDELHQQPYKEDKLLNNTDALIRILDNLTKNSYSLMKTIDHGKRAILLECISNKWSNLRRELKRILPPSTWQVLHDHAQTFVKLCAFHFEQSPLKFARQALVYKDMPVQLEEELIHLIDLMRDKHPRILDDILHDEYQKIKSRQRENIVITVLGSTKASKSSLINFLLDDEVCPTGNQAATARLTRITYGAQIRLTICGTRPEVYTFDSTEKLLEKAREVIILRKELRKSKSCQDEILIELPNDYLKGVELWDIPGFDENPVLNERIHEILNHADLILAVLSQQECLRQSAIDFIQPCLRECEQHKIETTICFIISQIDRYKPDGQTEETRQEFLQHIYDKICQELPTNFPRIDYEHSDQFITMCSSPRHSIKDYLECREQFIEKSCQWFHDALRRLTRRRMDLLLKCVREFSNYEDIFCQRKRYDRTIGIFNERFLVFNEELSKKVNIKLREIHVAMKRSIEKIAFGCVDRFNRNEPLQNIEEFIQSELAKRFQEVFALKSPEIIEMISRMTIEFSNTLELKPPEIQILKQILNETLKKDYYSSIIVQYSHTSPYHLSAYLTRICYALSETLKATIQASYEGLRKAYDQFIRRDRYMEDRTMNSITELVNEVLNIISDKLHRETERIVKRILNEQLEQIHKRLEKQVQKYIHSSSADIKINHLQQFYTQHAMKIKQLHLDILDVQFKLDFSMDWEINLEERLDQHDRFPVFTGTLGEKKLPIAAKLVPLQYFKLQEVLFIREIKHKNLMKYYGVKGGDGHQYYIIMPRMDCNLTTYLKDHWGRLTVADIDDIIVQIIKGLDYIHTQLELIHSDMRLDHILVNKEKKRFCIAHIGGAYREAMALIYSNDYSAFELLHPNNRTSITEKCDIYSLGRMIREILRLTKVEGEKNGLMDGWLNVSKKCCVEEPKARPSCGSILEKRSRFQD